MLGWVLCVMWHLVLCRGEFFHTFSGDQISPFRYAEYRKIGLVPYCAQEFKSCDENEPRRFDYSCNNLHHPARGAQMTPYRRLLPPVFGRNFDHRPSTSGARLPNVRSVRTSIMTDGRATSDTFSSLLMNGLLLITTDVTTIHDIFNYVDFTTTCCITGELDPRCRPIIIPDDDIHLRYSNTRCLNMTRVISYQNLGCVPNTLPIERVNTAPPMMDLSIVYGISEQRMRLGREFKGGRFRSEMVNGREWPPNKPSIFCLGNQLPFETRCHEVPNPIMNSLVATNVIGIWLYRNHNLLARQLEAMNPCWDDDRIFREAREINIAMANQILYYEMLPPLMGQNYLLEQGVIHDTWGHVNDYNEELEPRVSIEFAIGLRWFHTMQDGRLNKYTNKGRILDELKVVDFTLRTGVLQLNKTIEGITQGFFRQPAAEADFLVDPEIGERILGGFQTISDVVSSDLVKTREAALPPYVEYRKFCNLPVPNDFDDMREWMRQEHVEAFRLTYERVEDIDVHAGYLAEDPVPGGTLPPTLRCILAEQLRYFRIADRFWYENNQHPGALTTDQLYEIRRMSIARLICDNGDEVDSIQPRAFLIPSPSNKITNCKNIPKISLEPWKDLTCKDYEPLTPKSQLKRRGPGSRITGVKDGFTNQGELGQGWMPNVRQWWM